ncbi:class I SAM-dependent methyltransferase [uncultured Pseudokineococcus sp.]|uniref:class I SAM-dependent methyltransferase n=1 Tax=uncultured Pseudokineococcus sp. TaxID=1642928 RepID=UPI0026016CCE|nr:methyltransferase [uncultured Pseudokineococcus sp.]
MSGAQQDPDDQEPTPAESAQHYFTGRLASRPAGEDERELREVRLRGREVEVETAPGVFSAGRLDLGTRVLLREAPTPPASGDLLDLGCGWGALSLAMATEAPDAVVWAVDVSARALDLTRRNAERLGLPGVRAVLPEDVPDDVVLAALWSNPPIRVGKDALHELLSTWLPRLAPGADAHLVVQRNLGADSLQAWMSAHLGSVVTTSRAGSAKGFRVLRSHRLPGAATDGAPVG